MRAEVTGAVQLEQPQYQASELLIGVITHGYKLLEVPATIHKRAVGESKKGQNPLYNLHIPGLNNVFYGSRFMRVVARHLVAGEPPPQPRQVTPPARAPARRPGRAPGRRGAGPIRERPGTESVPGLCCWGETRVRSI